MAAREFNHGPGIVSNFEHPVVMKVLAGWALERSAPARAIDETRAGRKPFPFVFALLILSAGLFTAKRAGAAAGCAVAAILAVEPTLRGHAALVHTDLLLTALLTAAAFALDLSSSAQSGKRRRWILVGSGALYGLAMASKYSALPFLLVFAVAAVVVLERSDPGPRRRSLLRTAGLVARFLVLPALLTLAVVQMTAFSSTSDFDFRSGLLAAFSGLKQEAAVMRLADVLPKWAAGYGAGLLFVQGVAGPGERFNYFLGQVSGKGSALYFPVALALKLTAAAVVALIATCLGAVVATVSAGRTRRNRLVRLLVARAGLPAALGLAYLAAAAFSNVNIGVRHALPAVPFALVAAAGAARTLLARRRRLFRLLLVAVVLAAAAEAAARLGREISFGNVFAGGPRGIPPVLSDSNVDWSQEQGKVFDRVTRGDLGRVGIVTLVLDSREARRAGLSMWVQGGGAPVDTVFFSRHLWDLSHAIEKSPEHWPKFEWLRGWLPPLRHDVEGRAASIEPFGDAYLLVRLKPVTAPR